MSKPAEAKPITKQETERGELKRSLSDERREEVKGHLKSILADGC
jgi:hypothetical protein